MLLRTFIAGILLAAGAFAQMTSFPKPSYFRETFSKTSTKVELKDPVRLKDFVVGDKLELSLKNYLALVMANNTDIQIQMLSIETPKNAIHARVRRLGSAGPRVVHVEPDHHAVHQCSRWRAHHGVDRFARPAGPVFVCADPAHGHQLQRDLCGGQDQHLQQ